MIEEAQKIALSHPCRLGGETVHPRFARRGLGYTVVLTVNSGYE